MAYCAYQPEKECCIEWLDGDSWDSYGFVKIGRDEVEEWLHEIYLRKIMEN